MKDLIDRIEFLTESTILFESVLLTKAENIDMRERYVKKYFGDWEKPSNYQSVLSIFDANIKVKKV